MSGVIFAGGDVHDKSILVRVAVGSGSVDTASYRNTRRGRLRLVRSLRARARDAGAGEIHFAYEASSVGFGLHDELTGAGVRCSVLAPTKMRKSVHDRRSKTDEKDADLILEMLRGHVLAGNRLPVVWVPDAVTRDDRELVRLRLGISDEKTSIKARVKMLLKRGGLKAPEEAGQGWTIAYRRWLSGHCESAGSLGLGARRALLAFLKQLDFYESQEEELDIAVQELSLTERYRDRAKRLISIKGVGVLTAMVFLTEMGDLHRFRNRREVGSYFGLTPSTYESGDASDRKGRITKEGSSRIRRVLCQASWARIRSDATEKRFFEKLLSKNPKKKKKAIVATMRRLGILMWHRGIGQEPRPAIN